MEIKSKITVELTKDEAEIFFNLIGRTSANHRKDKLGFSDEADAAAQKMYTSLQTAGHFAMWS